MSDHFDSDQFEGAVVRMLDDLASVDRSLVVGARATIAALPDRKAGALRGLRRSIARDWPRRYRYALAGAAAVVVAVMAISLLGPVREPVATSPSPSLPTPTASADTSASVSPSASVSSVPSATRSGPAYDETLPVLLTGKYVAFAGWSPDGSRYAISAGAGTDAMVHVFDRSGAEIDTVAGGRISGFAWLDADRFVVLATGADVNQSGSLTASIGRVGSTQLTTLGQFDWLVAGPSGSIALLHTGNGDPAVNVVPTYVVVSADGGLSKPRDGKPVAWSRDGSLLAVYHPTGQAAVPSDVAPESLGWLEVVRSTGASVASTGKLRFGDPWSAAFSPDGSRMAFTYTPQPPTGAAQIAVLETRSGHVTTLPQWGEMTWASNDQLLYAYASTDYGKTPAGIMSWSASTGRTTLIGPNGDTVSASGHGSVVMGSDTAHEFTWTVASNGKTQTGSFSVGYSLGPGGISDSAWSPDGSSLILAVGDWNSGAPMDAVLLRPQ